jgi:hypothetical protein
MLIKEADDQSQAMAELERLATGTGPEAKRASEDLRRRKAGLKGEAESAYLINFEFGKSRNWAVIHDLRLEHDGRVAQIDHLLINRWMDIYVLESKHFHAGFKITEDGEFLQWNDYKRTYTGMPSPLEQNERHIAVLREVVAQIDLPTRLGIRIAPAFVPLILIAPRARIDRPKEFDSSRVIKADQLKKQIWKDIDDENPILGLLKTAAKIVSRETVEYVASQLAMKHKPLGRHPGNTRSNIAPGTPMALANATGPKGRIEPTLEPETVRSRPPIKSDDPVSNRTSTASPPSCKACHAGTGSILHGKFGYYFKCSACGANTNMRFTCQPGHNPRVRKERNDFYRECAECGTSDHFHRNADS